MTPTTQTLYDQLEQELATGGASAAFEKLCEELAREGKYHELFDARLMQSRHTLGLPITKAALFDEMEPQLRDQVEAAYLDACREAGNYLLEAGRIGEAWMYYKPVADHGPVAARLRQIEVDEENLEELLQIALHEGVAPGYGFELVLEHYGTCNAITLFEQAMYNKPRQQQSEVASLLVRRLHHELSENLRAEIERQEGSPPQETSIAALLADRDWLFAEDNYHIDTSHLNAVVRFSVMVDDPEILKLAIDLTEYGCRLAPQYQYAGDEPFTDPFPSYGLFLRALVGEQVDEALNYFKQKADEIDAEEDGTGAIEVYISLLARLERYAEALDAYAKYLPPGTQMVGFAPSLMELGDKGREYDRLKDVCRQRGDLVGFAAALVQQKAAQ